MRTGRKSVELLAIALMLWGNGSAPAVAAGSAPAVADGSAPAVAAGSEPAAAGSEPAAAVGSEPAAAVGSEPAAAVGSEPAAAGSAPAVAVGSVPAVAAGAAPAAAAGSVPAVAGSAPAAAIAGIVVGPAGARQLVTGEPCWAGLEGNAPAAGTLVFSDHPERVRREGLLCRSSLEPLRSVRFQFYHQGGADAPLYLVLRLHNRSAQKARISAVGGIGLGTELDYFIAGHQNNTEFLANYLRGQGRFYELEPSEERTVWFQGLPREIVCSGTVQWCLLQGRDVEYSLYSCASSDGPFCEDLLSDSADVHARGEYPAPERYRCTALEVGSWKSEKDQEYWAIGATRQPNAIDGPELKGDYGVLYRWELELRNSGTAPQALEFCLNPRGGKATGTFFAYSEGEWQLWERSSELEPFQFCPLAECELAPHSTRHFTIYTIPEGASNYPVRLVVRCVPREEAGK